MTATADFILEHVASYLKKNPVDIKMANLYKIGETNLVGETMMYTDFRSIYQSKKAIIRKSQQQIFIEENHSIMGGVTLSSKNCSMDNPEQNTFTQIAVIYEIAYEIPTLVSP